MQGLRGSGGQVNVVGLPDLQRSQENCRSSKDGRKRNEGNGKGHVAQKAPEAENLSGGLSVVQRQGQGLATVCLSRLRREPICEITGEERK